MDHQSGSGEKLVIGDMWRRKDYMRFKPSILQPRERDVLSEGVRDIAVYATSKREGR